MRLVQFLGFGSPLEVHSREQNRVLVTWEVWPLAPAADRPRRCEAVSGCTPFASPTVRSPNAGRINTTITSARQIQFALKFIFQGEKGKEHKKGARSWPTSPLLCLIVKTLES